MQSTEWLPYLPPARTPTAPSLLLLLLADPAPAAASPEGPEPRFTMSLFLQKITSGDYSRQANAVSGVASTEKHSVFNRSPRPISVNLAVVPLWLSEPVFSNARLLPRARPLGQSSILTELLQSFLTNSMDHTR